MKWKMLAAVMLFSTAAVAQVQTYCSNIGGNIACTSYGGDGAGTQSYCTMIGGNLSCTTYGSNLQVQRNYEAGQAAGAAIGGVIAAAIKQYREHKVEQRRKQDEWYQRVQDTLSNSELACESDPAKVTGDANATPKDCRDATFGINQFFARHQKDFVVDPRNLALLIEALDKVPSNGGAGDDLEKVFQVIDKKKLDKKPYVGNKSVW